MNEKQVEKKPTDDDEEKRPRVVVDVLLSDECSPINGIGIWQGCKRTIDIIDEKQHADVSNEAGPNN